MLSFYFHSFFKDLLKSRNFLNSLLKTNLKMQPYIFFKLISCIMVSESLLQYNRASFYQDINISELLKQKVESGEFANDKDLKEINNEYKGDIKNWYCNKVISEIRLLSITYYYSDKISQVCMEEPSEKKKESKPSLSLKWINDSKKQNDLFSKQESDFKELKTFKFSEQIKKEGISKDEFQFLWNKYEKNFN